MTDIPADRRTTARELAMQALCQLDIQGQDVFQWLGRFFREECSDAMTIELAEQWTRGAWDQVKLCDEQIKQAAAKWKLSRMSQVDRNILRLAVYQIDSCPDIPGKVILNEAIEMARKYSTEQSPRFVNGVLDAVLKLSRPSGSSSAAVIDNDEKQEGPIS
jgi:transcription antitermination factor NusB